MAPLIKLALEPFSGEPESNLILVDCVGTLYEGAFGKRNDKLIKFLSEMKKVGFAIQIFSSNPNGSSNALKIIQMRLQKENIDFDFGEVALKSDYDGKKAFIVIDDDHSSHNVDCETLYDPEDERIDKTLRYAGGIDEAFGKRRLQ